MILAKPCTMVAVKPVVAGVAAAFALTLGFATSLQADDQQQPYAAIAKRNVFGLIPPPPVTTIQAPAAAPVPEIKVCGFISLFGPPRVLFKVAGVLEPGKTVTETSHMLAAGQQEDGVKLLEIQNLGNQFVFDNHGTVQTVCLAGPPAAWKAPAVAPEINGQIPKHWGSYVFLEREHKLKANSATFIK